MIKKGLVLGLVIAFSLICCGSLSTLAVSCPPGSVRGSAKTISECNIPKDAGSPDSLWKTVNNILNVAVGILGIVAVGMIILGGFYILSSSGDAAKVAKGKNTIMYGVIGLVIAILAFAIVNFVLSNIFK